MPKKSDRYEILKTEPVIGKIYGLYYTGEINEEYKELFKYDEDRERGKYKLLNITNKTYEIERTYIDEDSNKKTKLTILKDNYVFINYKNDII